MANSSSKTFTLSSTGGSTGTPIPVAPVSASDIQNTFGGSNPIGLGEYYAGGGLVPNPAPTSSSQIGIIPTSGPISYGNFRGVANFTPAPLQIIKPSLVYGSQGSRDSQPRSWAWSYLAGANKNSDTNAFNSRDLVAQFGALGGTGNYSWSINAVYLPGETRRYTIDMNYNGFPGMMWIRYDQNRWITVTVTLSDGVSSVNTAFDVRLWW